MLVLGFAVWVFLLLLLGGVCLFVCWFLFVKARCFLLNMKLFHFPHNSEDPVIKDIQLVSINIPVKNTDQVSG